MSNFWSRLGQSLGRAGVMNARRPLLAWEASWDEAEALMASGKLLDIASEAAQVKAQDAAKGDASGRDRQPSMDSGHDSGSATRRA